MKIFQVAQNPQLTNKQDLLGLGLITPHSTPGRKTWHCLFCITVCCTGSVLVWQWALYPQCFFPHSHTTLDHINSDLPKSHYIKFQIIENLESIMWLITQQRNNNKVIQICILEIALLFCYLRVVQTAKKALSDSACIPDNMVGFFTWS